MEWCNIWWFADNLRNSILIFNNGIHCNELYCFNRRKRSNLITPGIHQFRSLGVVTLNPKRFSFHLRQWHLVQYGLMFLKGTKWPITPGIHHFCSLVAVTLNPKRFSFHLRQWHLVQYRLVFLRGNEVTNYTWNPSLLFTCCGNPKP